MFGTFERDRFVRREGYRERLIDRNVELYLSTFGAVCIEGPKWCGKTWTGLAHAKSAYMIADPANNFSNRQLAQLDVNKALEGDGPHLIDEWQEVPAVWDAVRFRVDESPAPGRFILTGSSTPKMKGIVHSGTGRIARLAMHPMSLYESGDSSGEVSLGAVCRGEPIGVVALECPSVERLTSLVVRGGWPGALGLSDEQAILIPREYVENVIGIDIHRIDGIERDSGKVRKCLRSLARNESTSATTSTIRNDIAEVDDSSFSINTVSGYLDAFKRLFLTHDTESFSTFLCSPVRIKQQAKRRFCDPSIPAALLGATPGMLMRDLRTFGLLFESLAVRDLEIYGEALGAKLYHYQDYDNDEFDAVLQFPDSTWCAFEVKYNPDDIEAAARQLVKTSKKFVHNPPKALAVIVGKHGIAHRREDGVYVLPLTSLKP